MPYPFDGLFAIDPQNPANVAANSAVTIFDPADFTRTPIEITDSTGMPIENPVVTNDKGFIGTFYAEIDEVGWNAGELQGLVQSFSGIRLIASQAQASAAVSAAEASAASEEARKAAGLVEAPADDAVAAMLADPDSGSYSATKVIVESQVLPLSGVISTAADPLAYLNSVKLLCSFPVREGGETSWPQGFSINENANEVYVANQSGSELRIDVRDFASGARKSSRVFVTENGAFTESLDWFYNGSDLCFIVWPKSGGTSPSAYAIANYSQGTLGSHIPILGFTRSARDGDKLITSDAWTNSVSKFHIYDWDSVTAGAPLLLDTVRVSNPGATAGKNQGLAAVGGKFFLAQGSQSESPTITAYHSDGRLADMQTYSRADFMDAINEISPGMLSNSLYGYECEGATSLGGKLVTGQIVNNNPGATADGVVLILQHNNLGGVPVTPGRVALKAVGDWLDIPLEAGWTNVSGNGLQARLKDGDVEFRGFGQNSTFTGGYTKVGVLPDGIPAPERDCLFHISGNTTAIRSVRITRTREIQFYTSAATASWYSMSEARYGM